MAPDPRILGAGSVDGSAAEDEERWAGLGLSFASAATARYDMTLNPDGAVLRLIASRKSELENNLAALEGDDLPLAELTFRVGPSAPHCSVPGALRLWVTEMVNAESIARVKAVPGRVSLGGRISVEPASHVALMAYVSSGDEQEIVNLARLGGLSSPPLAASAAEVPIWVRAVRSCHTTGETACSEHSSRRRRAGPLEDVRRHRAGPLEDVPASGLTGASSDSSIAAASPNGLGGCRLDAFTTQEATSRSGGIVNVTAFPAGGGSGGGLALLSATVPFRVWRATAAEIRADDVALDRVVASGSSPECAAPMYQRARLRASATLAAGGGRTLTGVDVTPYAVFQLAGPQAAGPNPAARLSGNLLTGLAPGNVTVQLGVDSSVSLEVTVSDEEVSVVALDTAVLTGLSLSAFPGSSEQVTSSYDFNATATLSQELSAEGQTARVLTYARFADGTAAYQGTGVTVASLDPGKALRVTSGAGEMAATVEVVTGAESACAYLVAAPWELCAGGPRANGTGAVHLEMPPPVRVELSFSVHRRRTNTGSWPKRPGRERRCFGPRRACWPRRCSSRTARGSTSPWTSARASR